MAILTLWMLWKEHNRRTFDHQTLKAPLVAVAIAEEVSVWVQVGYTLLSDFVQSVWSLMFHCNQTSVFEVALSPVWKACSVCIPFSLVMKKVIKHGREKEI
jgi:hypothetical protein